MKREDEEVRLQEVVRRSSAARLGRLWLAARVGCESGGAPLTATVLTIRIKQLLH